MTAYPPDLSPGVNPVLRPRPGKATAMGVMILISGIINILWGLTLAVVATINAVVGALLIYGLFCIPGICVGLLQIPLGIFEIIHGAQLLGQPPKTKPSRAIAIMEIICIIAGNIYAVIVGILVLVFANDQEVNSYFPQ